MVLSASSNGRRRCCMPRKFSVCCWFCLAFIILASFITTTVKAEKVVLLFGIYPARAADFGAPVPNYEDRINVMFPPLDSGGSLCKYPASLTDEDESNVESLVNAVHAPIALLLDAGASDTNCTAERQALIARKIQKRVTNKLKYIIIQGKPEDGDYLQVLSPDDSENVPSSLDNVAIMYVTYRTGLYMQQHVARRQAMWGGSPYFMDKSGRNVFWSLITSIEMYTPPSRGRTGAGARSDGFYWFRILLFTLLIASPCCRAGYLWWAGGGRIRFRRNENGRIVGLQYIPPMPYWLSNGMGPEGRTFESVNITLNEEQFNLLPEIVFEPHKVGAAADEDKNEGDGNSNADTEEEETTEEGSAESNPPSEEDIEQPGPASTSLNTAEEETIAVDGCDDHPGGENSTPTPDGDDEDNDPAAVAALGGRTTTCTMCSICIDDFEPGEKLTLLPRCQHAFHRDCIHPWLTERQGSCPLCKTYVIEGHEPIEDDYGDGAGEWGANEEDGPVGQNNPEVPQRTSAGDGDHAGEAAEGGGEQQQPVQINGPGEDESRDNNNDGHARNGSS